MTRATLGTRVNPSGLVEDVALLGSELVTNGDFTTDSDWDKTGTWSIESNYATASGNSTSQYIQQDFTITNGKTYLFTYEIIENTLNGNGSSLSGSGGFVSVSLSSVIGTHQVYITADDSGAVYALKIGVSGTATTGTIKLDNVSVKEATIDNLPRVDYTDGTSSLLVEPQRTNLIQYSENLPLSFSETDITSTYPYQTSPDGNENSTRLQLNNLGNSRNFYTVTGIVTSGNDYTLYCYYKGVLSKTAYIKAVVVEGGTDVSKEITFTGNWQREEITFTAGSGSNYIYLVDSRDGGNATDFEVWGAQLEEGSYPTSYIKTSGSTVTRNQETYTKTGISNLINSTEGVLFVEMAALSDDLTYRSFMLNDGTNDNRMIIRYSNASNTLQALCYISTGLTGFCQYVLTDETLFSKIAFKWKVNDFALWVDGVEVATDTSGAVPTGLNTLEFNTATDTQHLLAKVKQLQVYKTALTDTQLAALTS